jgi:hypothetical protein
MTKVIRIATLVALVGLAFLLGFFPMSDPDTWWHLRTAQLIVDSGSLPKVDTLTYTNAGRPWIDVYWLFQLALSALYKLGGASALVLMKATCGAFAVGLALLSRRRAGHAWALVLAWVPALLLLSGRLCERPELFSLVYLAAFLAVLGHADERPRLLWILPVVQILWVNSHGYFVFGPMLVIAYLAGQIVARRPSRPAAIACVCVALACLANPYRLRMFELPWQQLHSLTGDDYRSRIAEFRSPFSLIPQIGIGNPYLLSLVAMLAIGIASFAMQIRRRRPSVFRVLLFLGAAALGVQATRMCAVFALITAVVAVWNLDEALGPSKRGPGLTPIAAVVGVALWVLSGSFYAWAGEGRTVGLGEKPRTFAHEACAFLSRPGMPARVVAFNLGQAGVCTYHLRSDQRQFIDPRLEVNSAETFRRYAEGLSRLAFDSPGWESSLGIDYAKPAEVPAILIERGPLDRVCAVLERSPHWRRAYLDDVAAVFLPSAVVPQ